MKYAIQIPKPCHESWQEMTPESNGRHCAQCSKTVIDFTGWVQEDIHRYIEQQGPAKICGRFREEQLMPSDAERIIRSIAFAPLPLYKKVAAIFLLAFGLVQMSCNTETPKAIQHAAIITNDTPQKKIENVTLGMVAPPQLHQKQKSKTEHIVMGAGGNRVELFFFRRSLWKKIAFSLLLSWRLSRLFISGAKQKESKVMRAEYEGFF